MRVLVVEDDDDLRLAVSTSLRYAGFAVDTACDLPLADEALAVNAYDCVVFDRMLPSGDTLVYVRARRASGWALPVLFLTARDSVDDRILGLRHGDDYLVKPFAMAELTVRVGSLCRRGTAPMPAVLRCGDLELDTGRRVARRGGALLTLTPTEFAVLELLMIGAGRTVSRADLIRRGWDEMANPATNVLDVLISQLRRKLHDPPLIHTVRGEGYRMHP